MTVKLFYMPETVMEGMPVSSYQWAVQGDNLYAFRFPIKEPNYATARRIVDAVRNSPPPVGASNELAARRFFNWYSQPWPEDALHESQAQPE